MTVVTEQLSPAQLHLVNTHLDLAHSVALSFWRRNRDAMEKNEVVAIAYQGLITAALRFDPDYRPSNDPNYDPFLAFGSFAKKRITGSVLDWQRKQDHVPRRQRQAYKELQAKGHGTGRTPEELSDLTGLPADKIRVITHAVEASAVSYEEHDDTSPSVEESVFVLTMQSAVADMIATFSPAQRSVIVLRYFVGNDFPSIAAELGMGVMTVRSMHTEALALLHDVMKEAASA